MKINKPKCKNCKAELNLCEGDVLQIYQELLDELEYNCPECGCSNYIIIRDHEVFLESHRYADDIW